jgi:hypothetical protein
MVPQRAYNSLLRSDVTPVSNNALKIVHEAQIAPLRNIDTFDDPMHRGK